MTSRAVAFAALVAALWAYDGWNNAGMLGADIERPGRNLPRVLILGTGGVIGIWPVTQAATVQSYADSIARMVDVVGVDYVGVGTDQMGLTGPSAMPSYSDLPQLAAALSGRFKPDEINKLLGGNYRRVFETCIS